MFEAEVGDIDVGYGTARVLTAAETREALDAVNALSDEDLQARFDPQDMLAKEIYPEIWSNAFSASAISLSDGDGA